MAPISSPMAILKMVDPAVVSLKAGRTDLEPASSGEDSSPALLFSLQILQIKTSFFAVILDRFGERFVAKHRAVKFMFWQVSEIIINIFGGDFKSLV